MPQGLQQGTLTRTSQASISAALAAVTASGSSLGVRFPGEDGGHSLAEMAQRDLDAALQLLADRAQYITGSSGAAIALRRNGKKDMLCRASAGSNAPELGTLLSAEFGLSGESVRTRQVLRCDDAERDLRVDREACRHLGIASVIVMPVVNDDEVLGVFELFSGKSNAFGERDFKALRRLSEMVETAVRLARAIEKDPVQITEALESSAPGTPNQLVEREDPGDEFPVVEIEAAPGVEAVQSREFFGTTPRELVSPVPQALQSANPAAPSPASDPGFLTGSNPLSSPTPVQAARPLLWSFALEGKPEAPVQTPQDQVPASLRNLRQCEACGFPVSGGRTLCVECEEKKWRGRSVSSQPSALPAARPVTLTVAGSGRSAAAAAPAPELQTDVSKGFTASAVSVAPSEKSLAKIEQFPAPIFATEDRTEPASSRKSNPSPDFILSAGLEPSQSWLSAHKFVIVTLVLIAGAAAAFVLFHS